MTLSEKIVKLRTGRAMSQGDLAESLDVSRQSVSKWETGQSIPDLERIIRMADLFGVTVDELVRDRERPEPVKTEQQVIYVEQEKRAPSSALIAGAVLELLGVAMLLLGIWYPALFLLSLFPCLVGVMLLMVKGQPWFWAGWMAAALTFLIWNPWVSSVGFFWGPLSRLFSGGFDWTDGFALSRVLLLMFMVFHTYKTAQERDRKSGS